MTGPLSVVVMGVSGTGKSTVAAALAEAHGLVFVEGDSLHPDSNVAKMRAGIPLTDEDRWPWLDALAEAVARHHASGRSTILTCSALRRSYRDVLRRPGERTIFVHLDAPLEVLQRRMERPDHFMPASLLASQLDTLEPLEPDEEGGCVDVSPPLDVVTQRATELLQRLAPGIT